MAHDLLTESINVPAERAKLRQLRNEIAADVARREDYQRRYSPRGWPLLPDVPALEAEGQPADGKTPHGPLRAGSAVGIPAAEADVRAAQAGCGRCGRCACGVGKGSVKHG